MWFCKDWPGTHMYGVLSLVINEIKVDKWLRERRVEIIENLNDATLVKLQRIVWVNKKITPLLFYFIIFLSLEKWSEICRLKWNNYPWAEVHCIHKKMQGLWLHSSTALQLPKPCGNQKLTELSVGLSSVGNFGHHSLRITRIDKRNKTKQRF